MSSEPGGQAAGQHVASSGPGAHELAALYRFTDRLFRAVTETEIYEAALDAIAQAMGCERASILRFDEDDVMRFVAWRGLSDAYRAAVDGHTPWTSGQRDVDPLLISDIEQARQPEALTNVIRTENIRGLAFIPVTIAGAVVGKFMVYYQDHHDFTEQEIGLGVTIGRQMGFALERLAATELLGRQRERFEAVIEHIPVMIRISDPQTGELLLNNEFTRVLGWTKETSQSVDLLAQLVPDHGLREEVRAFIVARPDRWLDIPLRTRTGEVVETSWANIMLSDGTRVSIGLDITERRRALELQQLLLREMDHRIRNLFTLASGIVSLVGRGAEDPASLVSEVRNRLEALARAHALTLNGPSGADAPSASMLHELIASILSPYAGGQDGRISIAGDDLELSGEGLTSLALLLYEFTTNAAKYGALSTELGHVDVRTARQGDLLHLVWTEVGGPVPGADHQSEGFGSRLMRASARQLDSELRRDWLSEGLVITLRIPLGRITSPPPAREDQRLAS